MKKTPPSHSQEIDLAWHDLYRAALFETNPDKVQEKIAEAEKAILTRIRELFAETADHIEEDIILDDALYALRALKNCVAMGANAA
jgi:hypothetical protein